MTGTLEVPYARCGSADGTWERLERAEGITAIRQPGANIARGRNVAVRAAAHDVIAVSDADCVLEPEWLQLLLDRASEDGLFPILIERTPVRLDLTHSAWSDIFFLGMDYPEGARVLNISVDLGVHERDAEPRPPIETRVRVIPEPYSVVAYHMWEGGETSKTAAYGMLAIVLMTVVVVATQRLTGRRYAGE